MLLATVYKALVFAILCGIGAATEDLVREDRIVVFLFAAPAFWKEVTINAYKNACIHLDNNLIDGNAQSILIGGHTPRMVLKRKDDWYCTFYDNYDCAGDENQMLVFSDGVNNLRSNGWHTKVHALKCRIENE